MQTLKLKKVPDTNIHQKALRFRSYDDNQPTMFAIKLPFQSKDTYGSIDMEFDVVLDVVEGVLLFLLGFLSLIAVCATLHLKHMTLSFSPYHIY